MKQYLTQPSKHIQLATVNPDLLKAQDFLLKLDTSKLNQPV